jgi:hypothetical protein
MSICTYHIFQLMPFHRKQIVYTSGKIVFFFNTHIQWRNQDFFFEGAAKIVIVYKLNKKNYIVYKNLIINKTNYTL